MALPSRPLDDRLTLEEQFERLDRLEADTAFQELVAEANRFNIFEAIGAVNRELRHSDFLAFLLNPSGTHGLSSKPLSLFLKTLERHLGWEVMEPYLHYGEGTEVRREWQNVDILLINWKHRFIVAMENKIGADESPDQLEDYRYAVTSHFPGFRHLFVFLTPKGIPARNSDVYYSISYQEVASVIAELANETKASEDVSLLLRHYSDILKRHIVTNSDLDQRCRKLYSDHRYALDLIFERRPDRVSQIRDILVEVIQQTEGLVLGRYARNWVIFYPKEWQCLEKAVNQTYDRQDLAVRFFFDTPGTSLKIAVNTSPVTPDFHCVTDAILSVARASSAFNVKPALSETRYGRHIRLYTYELLGPEDYAIEDFGVLKAFIQQEFSQWLAMPNGPFQRIKEEILQATHALLN